MHLVGPDLDLHGGRVLAENGGVERLVQVVLRVGDIIVKLSGQGPPPVVDGAQGRVAVLDLGYQHAEREQVVYLADLLALTLVELHLLVDAVEVFGAARHLCCDPRGVQLGLQQPDDSLDVLLALAPLGAEQPGYLPVLLRIQVLKCQVLKEPLDLPHPQAMGQRRVYVQRLLGNGDTALGRERFERSHVVEAVSQLYQHDPDVFSHGHQHLPDARRLGAAVRTRGQPRAGPVPLYLGLGQLRDAVHELGDLVTEPIIELIKWDIAVFHNIVEEGGGQRSRVQPEIGQVQRRVQRVFDEGLPGLAHLPLVGSLREAVGLLDGAHLVLGKVLGRLDHEVFYEGHVASWGGPAAPRLYPMRWRTRNPGQLPDSQRPRVLWYHFWGI